MLEGKLNSCRKEAIIMWKINGKEAKNNLPFNFISLLDKKESSSKERTTSPDILSFYRNLLGLKLQFFHAELKESYRTAAGKYHPDKYGSSSPRDRKNAEMLMKQVNEAYENLKNVAA